MKRGVVGPDKMLQPELLDTSSSDDDDDDDNDGYERTCDSKKKEKVIQEKGGVENSDKMGGEKIQSTAVAPVEQSVVPAATESKVIIEKKKLPEIVKEPQHLSLLTTKLLRNITPPKHALPSYESIVSQNGEIKSDKEKSIVKPKVETPKAVIKESPKSPVNQNADVKNPEPPVITNSNKKKKKNKEKKAANAPVKNLCDSDDFCFTINSENKDTSEKVEEKNDEDEKENLETKIKIKSVEVVQDILSLKLKERYILPSDSESDSEQFVQCESLESKEPEIEVEELQQSSESQIQELTDHKKENLKSGHDDNGDDDDGSSDYEHLVCMEPNDSKIEEDEDEPSTESDKQEEILNNDDEYGVEKSSVESESIHSKVEEDQSPVELHKDMEETSDFQSYSNLLKADEDGIDDKNITESEEVIISAEEEPTLVEVSEVENDQIPAEELVPEEDISDFVNNELSEKFSKMTFKDDEQLQTRESTVNGITHLDYLINDLVLAELEKAKLGSPNKAEKKPMNETEIKNAPPNLPTEESTSSKIVEAVKSGDKQPLSRSKPEKSMLSLINSHLLSGQREEKKKLEKPKLKVGKFDPSIPIVGDEIFLRSSDEFVVSVEKDKINAAEPVPIIEADFLDQIKSDNGVSSKKCAQAMDGHDHFEDSFLKNVGMNDINIADKSAPLIDEISFMDDLQVPEMMKSPVAKAVPNQIQGDQVNAANDIYVPIMADEILDDITIPAVSPKNITPIISDDFLDNLNIPDMKKSPVNDQVKSSVVVLADELLEDIKLPEINKAVTPKAPIIDDDFLDLVGLPNDTVNALIPSFPSPSSNLVVADPCSSTSFKSALSSMPSTVIQDEIFSTLINSAEINYFDNSSTVSETSVIESDYKLDSDFNVLNFDVAYELKMKVAKNVPLPKLSHLLNFLMENVNGFPIFILFFQYLQFHVEQLNFENGLTLKMYQKLVKAILRREPFFQEIAEHVKNVPLMCKFKFIINDQNNSDFIFVNPELLELKMYPLAEGFPSSLMLLFKQKREWLISDLKNEFVVYFDEEFYRQLIQFLNDRPDLVMLQSPKYLVFFPKMSIVVNDRMSVRLCCFNFKLTDADISEKLSL